MKKSFYGKVLMAFPFLLFGLLLGWKSAQAEYSPPNIKTITSLKGTWKFTSAYDTSDVTVLPKAPAVAFTSGANKLLIHFDGKLPPHLQDSLNIALSDTYFGCNGEDFRIWFNNGEFLPLEVGRCDHGRVYLYLPIGVGQDMWKSYSQLFDFIQQGTRPILISESATGIKFSSDSEESLKSFKEASNPKTNEPYFSALKAYWDNFEKKHASSALSHLETKDFVPLDTEVIGALKGEWKLKEEDRLFPDEPSTSVLQFEAGPVALGVTLSSSKSDFLNPKGIIVRNMVHMKLCNLYFKCNAGPVKLWFDNGEYVQTAPAACLNDEIFATSGKGPAGAEQLAEAQKLNLLLKMQRPVALSQGKYAVLLDYHETASLDAFRREMDPKANTKYFEAKKRYYQEKATAQE
ncbi:hypothetical protein FAI40_04645 [Acetobacteraceae bacterium]|nr:hypothetical protein FAI40_04645 [Acetobacteraceae bacterium]